MKKILMIMIVMVPMLLMGQAVLPKTVTLSGASATVTGYFHNNYPYCYIEIKDTNSLYSSQTDTFKIERIDAFTPWSGAPNPLTAVANDTSTMNWTSASVGLKDCYNNQIVSDNTTIVPGKGLAKVYMILEWRPVTYRVSWKYGANKAGRGAVITFTGKQ